MSFNPLKLMQLKTAWQSFTMRHPKFPLFWKTVYRQGLVEGTVLEFKVTTPDGNVLTSNMKVSQADLDLLKQIQDSFS
ncbi:hypothetical protein DW974_05700 [Lachnospiraceae bacterium AM48-27BH]|nr:hypothetical protein DW974_05700 [Lachnospiraceae bacterium AM48-27BH]